jgi:hypothetical protein
MDMSSVVLVEDSAMMGIEIDISKLRVDPVGNVSDLFLLERIFSGFEVRFLVRLWFRFGVDDMSDLEV